MNRTEAIQKDKVGSFYADFDEESGMWCVFGTESGFAYYSYADKESADERAEAMEYEQITRNNQMKPPVL